MKLYTSDIIFPAEENIKAWLIRVTINLCKDMLRSNKRRTEMPICLCSLTSYQYTDLGIGVETINFVYSSELDGNITAFDVDDIKGISMNGTVFDLA